MHIVEVAEVSLPVHSTTTVTFLCVSVVGRYELRQSGREERGYWRAVVSNDFILLCCGATEASENEGIIIWAPSTGSDQFRLELQIRSQIPSRLVLDE
jgi:hypothetical protein